jgi:hypothetical protein
VPDGDSAHHGVAGQAPLAHGIDHGELDVDQVRAEDQRGQGERGLGERRPGPARQRGRAQTDEGQEAKPGDGDAQRFRIGGVLHGLAAPGRAGHCAARPAGVEEVSGDRGAGGGERHPGEPKGPLAHRASAASIAGTIPSGPRERMGTSFSRRPVEPSSKEGVLSTPDAFAAAAAR